MAEVTVNQIIALFTEVGQRHQQPATLLLLGGSALCLLGSPRPTLDIDYVGIPTPSPSVKLTAALIQTLKTLFSCYDKD